MSILQPLSTNLWHVVHAFSANGLPCTTRMTVVRLADKQLWLHSPVPIDAALKAQLQALGDVRYIVAPSKAHHLFAGHCQAEFPQARLFGAPGLRAKRPDLTQMEELPPAASAPWAAELDYLLVQGIPAANETEWFHKPSSTLIMTDLCQWWQGDLPLSTTLFAKLTGVRQQLDVSRTVRLLVRDKAAVQASAAQILQWPFTRVLVAHNSVVEVDAHAAVAKALRSLPGTSKSGAPFRSTRPFRAR